MKTKNSHNILILLLFIPFALIACELFHADSPLPPEHPLPLEMNRPQCMSCHDKTDTTFPYAKFSHDVFFVENHRTQALTGRSTCYLCHRDGFCSECHSGRLELKPSIRKPTATQRRMPHRGDYLARHQIAGQINPVSCYRCHGTPENAKRCVTCHGK